MPRETGRENETVDRLQKDIDYIAGHTDLYGWEWSAIIELLNRARAAVWVLPQQFGLNWTLRLHHTGWGVYDGRRPITEIDYATPMAAIEAAAKGQYLGDEHKIYSSKVSMLEQQLADMIRDRDTWRTAAIEHPSLTDSFMVLEAFDYGVIPKDDLEAIGYALAEAATFPKECPTLKEMQQWEKECPRSNTDYSSYGTGQVP